MRKRGLFMSIFVFLCLSHKTCNSFWPSHSSTFIAIDDPVLSYILVPSLAVLVLHKTGTVPVLLKAVPVFLLLYSLTWSCSCSSWRVTELPGALLTEIPEAVPALLVAIPVLSTAFNLNLADGCSGNTRSYSCPFIAVLSYLELFQFFLELFLSSLPVGSTWRC